MRINSKKPKGKKTMKGKKKNLGVATPGFEPAPQLPQAKKKKNAPSDHSAMRPLRQRIGKINIL